MEGSGEGSEGQQDSHDTVEWSEGRGDFDWAAGDESAAAAAPNDDASSGSWTDASSRLQLDDGSASAGDADQRSSFATGLVADDSSLHWQADGEPPRIAGGTAAAESAAPTKRRRRTNAGTRASETTGADDIPLPPSTAPAQAATAAGFVQPAAMTVQSKLSFEEAFALAAAPTDSVQEDGYAPRPRPEFLSSIAASPADIAGHVFVEDQSVRKRRPKTDLWEAKYGSRNASEAYVDGLGPEQLIRRSYGVVTPRPASGETRGAYAAWANIKLRCHLYEVVTRSHRPGCPGAQAADQCRCPYVAARMQKAPGKSATQTDPYRKVWHVLEAASEAKSDSRPAITGRLDTEAAAHTVRGELTLKQQAADDSWITFQDQNGVSQGQLHRGARGLTLTTTSGDFAEWHPRNLSEDKFEEGDVVSIGADGLTRDTRDATQVAVVSRWAAIEASAPPKAEQGEFDRVAYTGHVPVKLIGPCTAGDIIVPSGKHDGCAKAISSNDPSAAWLPRLGRSLETVSTGAAEDGEQVEYELEELSSALIEMNKVVISVTAPVASVPLMKMRRGLLLQWRCVLLAIITIVMTVAVGLAVRFTRTASDGGSGDHPLSPVAPDEVYSTQARATVRQLCQTCHGEGLYCERSSSSQASAGSCQRCGADRGADTECVVSTGASSRASCTATGGSICVPSPWPCSVCTSPALDASAQGCELSGGGDWGSSPPRLPNMTGPSSIQPGYVDGWGKDIQCLSDIPSSCLKPMMWNETNSVPPSCQYHRMAECGSDTQAFGLAAFSYYCGPSGIHGSPTLCRSPKVDCECDGSEWSWVGRACQVQGRSATTQSVLRPVERSVSDVVLQFQPHATTTLRSVSANAGGDSERCATQTISAIALDRCTHCGNKDVVLAFPSIRIGTSLAAICPPDTHMGNITRACGNGGWVTVVGACIRKTCAASKSEDLAVQVYSFLSDGDQSPWPELSGTYRDWSDPNVKYAERTGLPAFEALGATLHWAATPEGTTIKVPCPTNVRHTFKGPGFSRTCSANSTEWTKPHGRCVLQQCPSGPHLFSAEVTGTANAEYEVLMPAASLGATVELDCCRNFTKAGGCRDSGSSSQIGRITVTCGTDGHWPARPSSGRCVPSSSVKFRMDSTPESARTAFDTLRSMVTQASSTGTIELADSGALFSVSSALTSADTQSTRPHQDEWVSIASARTGSSHTGQDVYQSTLNAVSPGPAGRGAAALASVACRQFGFARASVVMNCGALLLLELKHGGSISCDDTDWKTTSDGWECRSHRWHGNASPLLRSLCGDSTGQLDLSLPAKIPWSGLGTDAVTDNRIPPWSTNPIDPHLNGGSDNPSMYMSTSSDEIVLRWNLDEQMFDRRRQGHPSAFARGWSVAMQKADENDYFGNSAKIRLRQQRGPMISNCVGDEGNLTQCFREPLLRRVSATTPLAGFDFQEEGYDDAALRVHDDAKEGEGEGEGEDPEPLPTIDWRQRLLFSCTDESVASATDAGGGSDSSTERIVVFGDKVDTTDVGSSSASTSLAPPRVFLDVLPHDCQNALTTIEGIGVKQFIKEKVQWDRVGDMKTACRWGTVLQDASE